MNTLTVSCGTDQTCECQESERIGIGGEGADITVPGDTSTNRYAFIENRDGHPWVVPATPAARPAATFHPQPNAPLRTRYERFLTRILK